MAEIRIKDVAQELRQLHRAAFDRPDRRRPRIPGAARRLGLRQDHAAAHHRRAGDRLGAARSGSATAASTICPPRDRGIAMVFQNYAVFPHLTVFENIAFGLRMQKMPQAEVDPPRHPHRRADAYRAVAEALFRPALRRPAPARRGGAGAGDGARRDPDGRAAVEPRRAAAAGNAGRAEGRAGGNPKTTTIYVTHDQVEAMSLADRIAVMNGGRIVQADRARSRSTATPPPASSAASSAIRR